VDRLRYIYFFILIGILSCADKFNRKSQLIIQEVKNEYAPDNRVAIFNIEALGTNPTSLKGETNLKDAKIELVRIFESKGIRVKDEITVLPNEQIGTEKYGLINVSVANLREQPKHNAELVTQALLGTPVILLKENRGWYLIQTPDKYIAWTNSSCLERINQAQLETWKSAQKIIYLNTYGFSLNPETSTRVSDLVTGNVLILEHENNDNWEVAYPDGRQAIIAKSEAAEIQSWKENIVITENSITKASKELMGVPYLWGGTSTKGLDCSGFTKTVYLLHGYIIPRDASQQVHEGELIDSERDFSKLKVGDLLFFGKKNDDQSERVVHVGLWLGNNQFIHASGDVHISSMDSLDENFDSYNYKRYLRTKRIIGSNNKLENILSELYL